MGNPFKPMPTAERVRERLDYDPLSGLFTWLPKPTALSKDRSWNGRYAGKVAGRVTAKGYVEIKIDGQFYAANRVAWLMVHGVVPPVEIDHWDTDKSNNRIGNLRLANKSLNGANQGLPRDNTSGRKGVTLVRRSGRWQAQITVRGRGVYLGTFDDPDDAAQAYAAAAVKHFGEFARIA